MLKAKDARSENFYVRDCVTLENELAGEILLMSRCGENTAEVSGTFSVFAVNSMTNTLKEAGYEVSVETNSGTFAEVLEDGRFVAMQWAKFSVAW